MQPLGSLTRPSDFRAVLTEGRRVSIPGVAVTRRRSGSGIRLGLSVRAAGAVERNRIKRHLRAAFRQAARIVPIEADVVVRADGRAAHIPFQELVDVAARSLAELRAY